jgi:hypothetical protein
MNFYEFQEKERRKSFFFQISLDFFYMPIHLPGHSSICTHFSTFPRSGRMDAKVDPLLQKVDGPALRSRKVEKRVSW